MRSRERLRPQHLAARNPVGNVDAGAMFISDFLDYCQTQASALGLGGDIGLKHAREDVVWKTRAMVQHAQAHAPGRLNPLGLEDDATFGASVSSRLGGVLRVLQQVVHKLAQLLRITQYLRAARIKLHGHGHQCAWSATFGMACGFIFVLIELQYIGNQGIQVQRFQLGGRQARVVPKLVDEALHGVHLVHNGFD